MLEEILNRRHIEKSLEQVESNKGAGSIDGMKWHELRYFVTTHWQDFRQSILEETYRPTAVKKVEKRDSALTAIGNTLEWHMPMLYYEPSL